jgi:hypothetical protein
MVTPLLNGGPKKQRNRKNTAAKLPDRDFTKVTNSASIPPAFNRMMTVSVCATAHAGGPFRPRRRAIEPKPFFARCRAIVEEEIQQSPPHPSREQLYSQARGF